ncbi:phage integrase family protein [Rhodoferax sp.]|uniref:phage integrase family protein n=1 Tax=Rhodoferax sp. TaxID=50421 RepID=UPI00276FB5CE|nr:tyrosine-type recombinase/integrase [Rhodoferax sp.]
MQPNPLQQRLSSESRPSEPRLVSRLGRHHFSHLRAVAEGLALIDSAKRYLGVEHGHHAKAAHRQTVEAMRGVARRHGESAWRLLGISIPVASDADQPTLDDFIAERGLDGWRESEIAELYAQSYPQDGGAGHKARRRARLRERQLALIRKLEALAAEMPSPTDLITGWFDDATAMKLLGAGMVTLGDLNRRVSDGGRWYRTLPAIGASKAHRIEAYLATLLPQVAQGARPVFALTLTPSLFQETQPASSLPALPTLGGAEGQLLEARNDLEAVDAWVNARAGSTATATVYRREGQRLLLWLQYERQGKGFAQMTIGDCRDYMAFLQNIPANWISRVRAAPGQPGWAPFRGALSHKSQRQAVVIIAALFTWLQAAQYLVRNPWPLVNQKTGDDRTQRMLDTKALSEAAFAEIQAFVLSRPPSPSRHRILFVLRFVEAVGLRSSELLNAKLGDIQLTPEGWMLQVHGKGAKNRIAIIPGQALLALQDYLAARGLGGIEVAPPSAPLLGSTIDPMEPIGYQALYEHVNGWIAKAVSSSALPSNERLKLAGATTHWLRHTFGTRAVARQVPADVIQAQMGHASIQTTLSIYGRAPLQRRNDELAKAFG